MGCDLRRSGRKGRAWIVRCTNLHIMYSMDEDEKNKDLPTTSGSTFFAQSTSTEFATEQGTAGGTNDFTTIITLIHFITISTVKGITSIADSNLMIGLIFMTPMTSRTNIGLTFITTHLYIGGYFMAVQTPIFIIIILRGGWQ